MAIYDFRPRNARRVWRRIARPIQRALAIAPPFLAGFWWCGPSVLWELRVRLTRESGEMSPPQLQSFYSIEKSAVPSYVGLSGAVSHGPSLEGAYKPGKSFRDDTMAEFRRAAHESGDKAPSATARRAVEFNLANAAR